MKTNKFLLLLTLCLMSYTTGKSPAERLGLVEKIYTQTDRSLYFPGETIWFKAYVVDGENKVTTLSEVGYAELISPRGNVIERADLAIEEGYTYYQFTLKDNAPGGRYTLKVYTRWMQEQGEEFIFSKELIVQNVVTPNILLTLDLKKTAYGAGQTFEADFTAHDLENNPLTNTEISYRTVIEGKTVDNQKMQTDQAGKALITGTLPGELNSKDALLLVNINYRNQMESISRSIPIIMDNTDLQFLPEGGQALVGQTANFAFRAVNEFGKPVDVSGIIIDEKENEITTFTSAHDGMGTVNFIPESGRTYNAKITKPYESTKTYPLKGVTNEGVHLYYSSKKQSFDIRVNTEKEVRMAVVKNGVEIFQKNLNLEKGSNNIDLPISEFSMGIHKVVIKNNYNVSLAERLIFLHPDRHLNIEIETDKERYQNREKMSIRLRTTDSENKPVPANLSVGITDEKINNVADDKQGNILANLLLTSELNGKIHEPNYYFDKNEKEGIAHLDLLMLTHGWRSYLKNPILNLEYTLVPPERADWQTGTVTDRAGKGVAAKILLVDNRRNEVIRMTTDERGAFRFLLAEKNHYGVIAYRDNNQSVKIKLNTNSRNNVRNRNFAKNAANLKKVDANELKMPVPEMIEEEGGVFELAMAGAVSNLDEVVVKANSISGKNASAGLVAVVNAEDLMSVDPTGLLSSKVAGVMVDESSGRPGGSERISIRGTNSINGSEPLFVIDGIVVKSPDGKNNVLDNLNPEEIESVSVVKGLAASAMYGSQGANGVIVINTKNSIYTNNLKEVKQKKLKKYAYTTVKSQARKMDQPSQFYHPIYKEKNPKKRSDFRNTIYWNPVIQTDENGEATFTTFTNDALTSFAVTVEGVSAYGQLGYQQKKIFTQKELSVNATMPAFLSVGDTLKIPVTIVNNSDEKRFGRVFVNLPDGLRLLSPILPVNGYEVEANSFKKIFLTCLPIKPGKNQNIQIRIHTAKVIDQLNQKLTIVRKDFPATISMNGAGDKKLKFELTNPVEKSIKAELKIYLDVVGQAMDGIDGILRQPYGCFEQTSSCTYPNVLVLNYLRETGKSNKAIEEKAMKFIKKGYERLLGFETSKRGYEWFGKTPPHETLTAYGILEFTEMQEVYDGVDQKMIDRTVKWLLGRRDRKGGFKKATRGRSSFHNTSKVVANAYIVYALSKVKKINETKLEYQTAVEEALKSGDPYRMGLMLRAAQFRDDTSNEKLLLSKIDQLIDASDWSGLSTEETIVRSGDKNAKVETASILAMGLMEYEEFQPLAAEGIQFILSNRKNGRFGATQATCLAIEAMLDYAKKQEEKLRKTDGSLLVTVNGHQEEKSFTEVKNGILKIDQLEDFITAGEQEVEVKFLNAPLNIPFTFDVNYFTSVPRVHPNCPLKITTTVAQSQLKLGDNLRLAITVKNTTDQQLPMTTALVGIPSGASVQPWQLKEIMEREEVAYYEIFDHYLVFYWRHFKASEEKTISLDLKTEFEGTFESAPACVYLYYSDEERYWTRGERVGVY